MIIITFKFGINQSHFPLLSMLVYTYVYTCIHIQSLTLIFGHLLKRNNLCNIGTKLDFTFYDKLEGLVDWISTISYLNLWWKFVQYVLLIYENYCIYILNISLWALLVLTSYKLLKMVKIADYRDLRLTAAIISFYICLLLLHQLISMKFPACISNWHKS